jgi:hypothetical protein
MLMYFPALRNGGIELGAMSKLARAEILGDFADATSHVIPAEKKRAAVGTDAT